MQNHFSHKPIEGPTDVSSALTFVLSGTSFYLVSLVDFLIFDQERSLEALSSTLAIRSDI